MSDTPSGIFRRTAEVKVPISAIVQSVLTLVLGWLFTMMLGMDARVARIEAARAATEKAEDKLQEATEKRLTKVEDANTKQWERIRELQERGRGR